MFQSEVLMVLNDKITFNCLTFIPLSQMVEGLSKQFQRKVDEFLKVA